MGVWVSLNEENEEVFDADITHNLSLMAEDAGIYQAIWHPEEIGATHAKDISALVKAGLEKLKSDPKHFKKFNASNGWGKYEDFVSWVEEYLKALEEYPEAEIGIA